MTKEYTSINIQAILSENGKSIKHIGNPSEELQLIAVRDDGLALEYITNASEQVKQEAVKQDPLAIKFINKPSHMVKQILRANLKKLYGRVNTFAGVDKTKTDDLIELIQNPIPRWKIDRVNTAKMAEKLGYTL